MKTMKRGLVAACMLLLMSLQMAGQEISGTVVDAKSKEPLIGATIEIAGGKPAGVTDMDGRFRLTGLKEQKYTLIIRYVSYKAKALRGVLTGTTDLVVEMNADEQTLKEVQITAAVKQTTETAMVQLAKESPYVMSNISSQEIRRTQDSNAGEVIRRVPGVSLIEDKFVMVRGLSQRYNNVWVNGGAVPSSEADSRAFSFDIVPSSQIDNLLIVKTQSPEYPSDYSGGFIVLNTKEIPSENSFSLSLGGNWNTQSAFQDFTYAKGSNTDFLGFDGGLRSLDGGIHSQLKTLSDQAISLLDNGLNNDWHEKTKKPLGDLKLSANWNHQWDVNRYRLGMIVVLNYSNEYRTYRDMENNLFGIYDAQNDRENYLRQSVDNQFNNNVRLGSMFNLTLMSKNGKNKYQLKNIFNQLGNNRYTERNGISAQSNNEQSAEYYYRSRTTYNAQLTGKHTLKVHELDWNVGYAYANRHIPDRRRYLVNDAIETNRLGLLTGNDVSREWTQLDEHIVSGSV
ncbi:MAG: carboxypeptidase-like regulatory domain-containing protein, partial [Hoylesella buccalis]